MSSSTHLNTALDAARARRRVGVDLTALGAAAEGTKLEAQGRLKNLDVQLREAINICIAEDPAQNSGPLRRVQDMGGHFASPPGPATASARLGCAQLRCIKEGRLERPA